MAVAAFELGNVAATLLILRATQLLTGPYRTRTATSLAYTLYNVAATVMSVLAGRASDRLGAKGPLAVFGVGVAVFGVSYLGLALAGGSVSVLAVPFVTTPFQLRPSPSLGRQSTSL